jgi:hypothetical protein
MRNSSPWSFMIWKHRSQANQIHQSHRFPYKCLLTRIVYTSLFMLVEVLLLCLEEKTRKLQIRRLHEDELFAFSSHPSASKLERAHERKQSSSKVCLLMLIFHPYQISLGTARWTEDRGRYRPRPSISGKGANNWGGQNRVVL